MQKLIPILFLIFMGMSSLSAQQNKREKLKAYKTAYLTEQLDLAPQVAEKFWPVYNDYEKDIFELKVIKVKKTRAKIKDKGGMDAITEKEADQILTELLTNEQAVLDAKKQLLKDLKKILTSKQLLILQRSEHDFNRKLLSDYRRKKGAPKKQ